MLVTLVSVSEIEKVILSTNVPKAPSVDGFSVGFYRACWNIIKQDVLNAILDFFMHNQLLRQINITSLMFISKASNPSSFAEFRLISVCQMIYWFKAKVLANKIKYVIPKIINDNQHAFVQGPSIHENIMVCYELMHNYYW